MTNQTVGDGTQLTTSSMDPSRDIAEIDSLSAEVVKADISMGGQGNHSKPGCAKSQVEQDSEPAVSTDKTDLIEKQDNDDNSDGYSILSVDSVGTGMALETKQLYQHTRRAPWVDYEPDDKFDLDMIIEYKRYALVVRRQKDPNGPGLLFHSITIHSPLIREFLAKVFDGYRGVFTTLKDLAFTPPFHEFFYRWDQFQQVLSATTDELALQHIDLLHKVIAPEIQPHLDARKDLLANGLVSYEYLWALFEPDTEVFEASETGDRLYISRENYYDFAFHLSCEYIDYNGTMLGWTSRDLTIDYFPGHIPISELKPIPSALVPDIVEIKQRLKERGKAFEALKGMHYKSYLGPYIPRLPNPGVPNSSFRGRKRNIDEGRIVIDAHLYREEDFDSIPRLRALDSDIAERRPVRDHNARYHYDEFNDETIITPWNKTAGVKQNTRDTSSLLEEEYHLCSPFVQGYCLPHKLWGTFEVSRVAEIQWDTQAFSKLVLPHDYKELILAFSESQFSHNDNFDDIISGKGQGIVMLLSGEPGVGKTLTAEAVSEEMKTPLYAMSAGELGNDAASVETKLQKILDISAKWDAILLIDECDVFLEQRTVSDLERNKLVAVFLRLLEYYKGVMFLTTNRVSSFDAAFQSRIHLTINYPSLDESCRLMVWQTFVSGTPSSTSNNITDSDLAKLARLKLNGREIKNIIKTARLLANRRSTPLAVEHIDTVLRIKNNSAVVAIRGEFQ